MKGRIGLPPTMPSNQSFLNSTAYHHAHLGSNTQMHNATNGTNGTLDNMVFLFGSATDHVASRGECIMSYVILSIILAFLFAIVAIDMRAKHRSGELREDMRGAKNVLVLVLKVVPMLPVALFSKIGSMIPRKQAEPAEADSAAAAQKTRQSQVIVQRLAAKSASKGTTISVAALGDDFDASS